MKEPKLSTPPNHALYDAMKVILTKPLAKLLRNKRTKELLLSLNCNVETPNRIWGVRMREELASFLDEMEKGRNEVGFQTIEKEIEPAMTSFQYTSLSNEVIIGGVYVRIFNSLGGGREGIRDISDCSLFAKELLLFIARSLDGSDVVSGR
eukprot:246953-Ditylum_brightwellii.AAC.1